MHVNDRYCVVNGLAAHYLEVGAPGARPVVLLHGGAWGESARCAWYPVLDGFAERGMRVLAPDWLGFGESAKVRDFEDLSGRMLGHLAGLLGELGIERAAVVGLSMGGSHLLRAVTAGPALPVERMVLVSAGGAPIDKSAGTALMDYDGSDDAMRAQIRLAVASTAVAADAEYLRLRQDEAHRPGGYEFFRSLGLRAPWTAPVHTDIAYESIAIPTLVLAGGKDALKPPGFSAEVAARIPGAEHHVFPDAGHCPQLDEPAGFVDHVASFLLR